MERQTKNQILLGFVLLLIIPAGSLVGPGQAAVTDRLPDQSPEKCIANPERPDASNPDVTGSISRVNDSQLRVSYEVANQSASLEQFAIKLQTGATLVNQTGFEGSTFGSGEYWNPDAEKHELVYQMESTQTGDHQVNYPSDDNWMFAATPQHYGARVDLTAEPEGYIGGNTLYLGEYSTEHAKAGCQEFVAIIPETVRFGGVSNRLEELTTAARSLPVGHQYRTVRIFVSPEQPGDTLGFVSEWENEIVVVDRTVQIPTSTLWIHEYVHTVQDFRAQPDMWWFSEASAEYLSFRIAVESGYISPIEHDYLLGRGAQNFNQSMITSPQGNVAYQRGAVVLSQLELELFDTYNQSVVDMVREMNTERNPGQSDVVRWLRDDIGMPADDARHTLSLVNSGERLYPPFISSTSDSVRLRTALYVLKMPILQLMCGILGVLWLADAAYTVFLEKN